MAHARGRASWDKKHLVNSDSAPLANSLPLTRLRVNHSGRRAHCPQLSCSSLPAPYTVGKRRLYTAPRGWARPLSYVTC